MWARVIKRIDVPIDIKEGYAQILGLNACACAGRKVGYVGNGDEIGWHSRRSRTNRLIYQVPVLATTEKMVLLILVILNDID